MKTVIAHDAKTISGRLKENGYSKERPFVFEDPVTIVLCYDSRRYYCEYERKVKSIWPDGDTFCASITYEDEIWKGNKLVSTRTIDAVERIDTTVPTDDDDYDMCEYHSYNLGELMKHQEEIIRPIDRQIENAKPYIDIINDIPYLIVHDMYRFAYTRKTMGTNWCLKHNAFDEFEIKFSMDELRQARFSINKGTAGPYLRLSLEEHGETCYYFLAEKFDDIKELLDFEIVLQE